MPCHGGPSIEQQEAEARAVREAFAERDVATRLLCAICKELSGASAGRDIIDRIEGGELASWLLRHKKIDAARNLASAKAKLTPEEFEAIRADIQGRK